MNILPLLSTWGLVFVAELPGKTTLALLLFSAHRRAGPILLGAFSAFAIHGVIAVSVGGALGKLPPQVLAWATALLFLAFGLILLLRKSEEAGGGPRPAPTHHLFAATFGLVFIAQWGDASQVATIALAAHWRDPWQVYIGATLALWAVAALAVQVGRTIGPRLPRRGLRLAAGILFCAFGVLTLFRGL